MKKNDVLKLVVTTFCLVGFTVNSTAFACDFSEGSDQNIQEQKIISSAPIHTNNSVEAMYCEGIPYNDTDDKIVLASASLIHKTTGSMFSEGVSDEELENMQHLKIVEEIQTSSGN